MKRIRFAGLSMTLCALAVPAWSAPITLAATVKDFCSSAYTTVQGCTNHVDFDNNDILAVSNAVTSTLGADGRPVFNASASSMFSTAANFGQWYLDVPASTRPSPPA